MGDFFKGWRRKIGCVTLVMSLVFMMGWIRSHGLRDSVFFPTGKITESCVFSGEGFVGWANVLVNNPAYQPKVHWAFGGPPNVSHTLNQPSVRIKWNWCGVFAYDFYTIGEASWILPYWFIVCPLTVLSAFLLLPKRKKSPPKKLTEPIPTEGA